MTFIRANADIGGVRIGDVEHKVAAYADNILPYGHNSLKLIACVMTIT